MAIKNLAIAYNGSSNADIALCFAIQMGKKYQAHLTGLHVHRPLEMSPLIQKMTPKYVLDAMQEADQETSKAIEAKFHLALDKCGFENKAEWICEKGDANDYLCRFARYYDLLIIGQAYDGEGGKNIVRPEDLVARSGRPLLTIPNHYNLKPFSEYAVVAWDGSRSAARALADAMQILETKKKLDIVTVKSTKKDRAADSALGRDIIEHLCRHGVDAKRVILSSGRAKASQVIIDYCADKQPDVLILGAYSNTRLREEIFGGMTRDILNKMNVPVFMSH